MSGELPTAFHQSFRQWLERSDPGPWFALHDYDADGIAAGVLFSKLCHKLKREVHRASVGTTPDNLGSRDIHWHLPEISHAKPSGIAILDLGSYSSPVLPEIRTIYIDHHQDPTALPALPGEDPHCLTLNGKCVQPSPCTSVLLYELMREVDDFSECDWIACIGAYSDLGDNAPFRVIEECASKYSKKALRDITSLINSGRRGPVFQPELAAQVLLTHATPEALLGSQESHLQELCSARQSAHKAFQRAKQVAPRFSKQAALLQIHTPCRIHGQIAQVWRNRLPDYYVLVGNTGLEGTHVEFSSRCRKDKNALEWLAPHIKRVSGRSLQGHPQASGGRLSRENWQALLSELGFGEKQKS